jgi:pimeloyl-ACP methyl ester carboxylesterase
MADDSRDVTTRQVAHLAGLHLVAGASHWPQWDQPEAVAELAR